MHYPGRMEHPPLLNQRLAGASGLASQPVRAAAATPHRRGGSAHRNLRNPRLEVRERGVSRPGCFAGSRGEPVPRPSPGRWWFAGVFVTPRLVKASPPRGCIVM